MALRRSVAVVAGVLAGWPLPLGVGYLLLRQWARFVVALLLQCFVAALVGLSLGPESRNIFLVGLWFVVLVDTLRLAVAEWKSLPCAA